MKLYLTSVSKCLYEIESFKSLINKDTKLVILPFSYHKDYINKCEDIWLHFSREPNNPDSIFWSTVRPFIDAGIDPENITVINQYSDNIAYIKYKLTRENTIVYLTGGYPENIVENMHKYDLLDTIKQCEVIVGESAGSMAVFKEFFVYKDPDYTGYKKFKGLNLIKGMTFIPHLVLSNPFIFEACRKFKKQRRNTTIFCVKDGGYVVIKDGAVTEVHKAYTFELKKKGKRIKDIISSLR
jgi:peptidase E